MRESYCSVAKRLRTAKDARCILFDHPPPLCLFSSDQRQVCRSESFPQPMWPGTRQGTLKSPANREHDREWPNKRVSKVVHQLVAKLSSSSCSCRRALAYSYCSPYRPKSSYSSECAGAGFLQRLVYAVDFSVTPYLYCMPRVCRPYSTQGESGVFGGNTTWSPSSSLHLDLSFSTSLLATVRHSYIVTSGPPNFLLPSSDSHK